MLPRWARPELVWAVSTGPCRTEASRLRTASMKLAKCLPTGSPSRVFGPGSPLRPRNALVGVVALDDQVALRAVEDVADPGAALGVRGPGADLELDHLASARGRGSCWRGPRASPCRRPRGTCRPSRRSRSGASPGPGPRGTCRSRGPPGCRRRRCRSPSASASCSGRAACENARSCAGPCQRSQSRSCGGVSGSLAWPIEGRWR